MFKVVMFDLDGTLIDSSEGVTKSAQFALKHYGIEEDDLQKLTYRTSADLYLWEEIRIQ